LSKDFKKQLGHIKNNYLLFAVVMYIIDQCNISVRTFNDSSPFYYSENQFNKNYSICNYSMHGANSIFKNIPNSLVECTYEDRSKNIRKSFTKSRPIIPRLIMAIRRKLGLT